MGRRIVQNRDESHERPGWPPLSINGKSSIFSDLSLGRLTRRTCGSLPRRADMWDRAFRPTPEPDRLTKKNNR
ncbi:hypothetical protein KCV03_g215, partial [Aureobasidium melanogenum]